MPRPRKSDRPVRREIYLPESLDARVQMLLFSPVEGRVPQGEWSRFIETLLRQALDRLPSQSHGA